MLTLTGKQIYLCEFTEENLQDERYFLWLRELDVVTMIYRLEYLMPLQRSEVEKYVRAVFASNSDCLFAIYHTETQEFIGTLKIGHIDWRTGTGDIGLLIGEKKYWGRRIAQEVVSLACKYAFNVLSLRKLTAGTPAVNIAMCKCFEKIGFQREAQLRKSLLIGGEFVDHILFGLFKEEFNQI